MHSGMTGLANMVYNKSTGLVIIADNSTTGMTGHQQNPLTGKSIKGEEAPRIDLIKLCEAMGIRRIQVVDPFDLKGLEKAIKEELAVEELSVIITQRPCALLKSVKVNPPVVITDDCINCGMCMKIGCPAIIRTATGPVIDTSLCTGCGLCEGICPKKAIVKGGDR